MGAKIDRSVYNTPCPYTFRISPYTFRISGQKSHFIGSLLPVGDRAPSFLQLYIYDTTSELDMRANAVRKDTSRIQLDKNILSGLKNMLDETNPLAKTFRMAQQRIKEDKNISVSIRILGHRDSKAIKNTVYNSLTASEVAALIVGDLGGASAGRDIIVDHKEKGLKRINELHPSFMALQYPLLFPYGEDRNLVDIDKGNYVGATVGTRTILPATFTGCARYMQQNYQDEMAKCRWFGNPHLFITFTANPKWPEVESMLKYIKGQKAEVRADIVARVFKLKLRQQMDYVKKERYFGTVVADVYTIEFQKRGLPHAHILLWLKPEEVDLTTQFIDNIICAEIPDREKEHDLYKAVSRYMVHGPCGRMNPNCSCMINNTCSKKFPKKSNQETVIDNNGYPIYRRRENGKYLSACESAWRIFEFDILEGNPSVIRLPVHLEVEQVVVLRDHEHLEVVIERASEKETMLTAWMTTNTLHTEARALTYAQFPTKYVWNKGWLKRKQGMSICWIVFVHSTDGERYYLRLLLNIVKGAQNFEDVRTVKDRVYPIYEMISEGIERQKRRLFCHPNLELTEEAKKSYTLIEVEKILLRYGKTLKDINNMPLPKIEDINGLENKLIRDERLYDRKEMAMYDKVTAAVENGTGGVIFLYGHGGTGKTFLYRAISAKVKSEGKIVLIIASSGIAALLLPGGRTAHSRLAIPIDLFDNSTCNIGQKNQLAELLRDTSLIIWDEAPMDHRFSFEAVNRTMRDIIGFKDIGARSKLFGGKTILLWGGGASDKYYL
ncbi:uncharacterized protein LOC141601280 [Silene latifolia]|uniref:uncharacterized protein LOC141601280 n=1 Tax=Silene latifolia TaxID=37657 RepID=UPI003D76F4E5